MKKGKLLCILALTAMLFGVGMLPEDSESKVRFLAPPEITVMTVGNTWAPQLPVIPVDDGQDTITLTLGGDDMASTGWQLRSNGQNASVDLRGKTLVPGTARLRFRGVGSSTESVEYKTSSPNTRNFLKSGGVTTTDFLSVPAVPAGYTFDRITASASVVSSVYGSWAVRAAIYGLPPVQQGNGTSGSASQTSTFEGDLGADVEFYALHAQTYNCTFTVTTRGKKVTVITTQSVNPSCAGASSSNLANGVTSGWSSINLTSGQLNTFAVSVGGSGQVEIEIEYEVKAAQPAPSAPSVSGLTPTSVTLTSNPGSQIVCNGETKASGSIWTGLSELTAYSAYAYMPETATHERSPNSGSTPFTTPSSAGPPSVQTQAAIDIEFTSAIIRGNVSSANGATPTRYLRWGYSSDDMPFEIPMGEGVGAYQIELSGLEPGQRYYFRAYATNTYGTGNGAVLHFETPYPILDFPVTESPANGARIQDRRPWLIFTLPVHPDNPAEALHARARISEYSSMTQAIMLDSVESKGEWQYWSGSSWLLFPSGGVPQGTRVRCRPSLELPYRAFYWDCAAHDGVMWGANSFPWTFRILIAVTRTFTLVINDQEAVGVMDIIATETCNGELGEISFSLDNKDGQADEIQFNDLVILGINDDLSNVDEFRGLVREKTPLPNRMMRIVCGTGDWILAERIVRQNYSSQDIGLILKSIVDTYCAPLTSVNINTSTGIIAAIDSNGMNALQVFEQFRRDYGIFFLADNQWDVHVYLEDEIEEALVQIQYGANGIVMSGVM